MPDNSEQSNSPVPAKHPGGVKTPEGKAVSKYNAERHAILRETLTKYEAGEAGRLYDDLSEDLKPEGRLQELLVEMIGSNVIRLQRIAKAEAELVKQSIGGLRIAIGAYAAEMGPRDAEYLLVYSRYQTATENRIYRAVALLKHLKSYDQIKTTT